MIVACHNCGGSVRRKRQYKTYFCDVLCRAEFSRKRIDARVAQEDASNSRACPQCKTSKPLSDFWPNSARQDGLSSWCKQCQHRDKKRRHKENPTHQARINWRGSLKYNHGITEAEYNRIRVEQFSCCAICEDVFPPECVDRLGVDHDHDTGAIRGLLCRGCNLALGLLKDDWVIVEKAAKYLREKSPDTRERRLAAACADLDRRLEEKSSLQGVILKLAEGDR